MGDFEGMLPGIGMGVAGEIMGGINRRAQFGRQRQLMGMQQQNQMQLNRQGLELGMEQWRRTNYPAQIEMLKKAGLNPSLIYGKGGAGGSTGASSGGSAAMGKVPEGGGMMNLARDAQMMAQIKLTEAQTKNVEAQTRATDGYQKDEAVSRIKVNDGKVTLQLSQEELNNTMNNYKFTETQLLSGIDQLNNSMTRLNDQRIEESKVDQEWKQTQIDRYNETGIHPNDPIVGKTIQYLSNQTGLSEKMIIGIIGTGQALKEIMKLLPVSVLRGKGGSSSLSGDKGMSKAAREHAEFKYHGGGSNIK